MPCIGGLPVARALEQINSLADDGYTVITRQHYDELTDGPRASAQAAPQSVVLAPPDPPESPDPVTASVFMAVEPDELNQIAIPTDEFLRLMAAQYPETSRLVDLARATVEAAKVQYPKHNWDLTPNRYKNQGRTAANVFWFIVHTTEGRYIDAYNIFKNPRTQAGPHVLTSIYEMPNGVDRMAPDADGVWTAAHPTYNKGGDQLEQGDRKAGTGGFTEAEYKLNGHLYAYYASVHDLRIGKGYTEHSDYMRGEKGTGTRPGAIGHHHVPFPSTHWDPGPYYDFDKMIFYANKVLQGDMPAPKPQPKPEPKPEPPAPTKTYRIKWPAGESRDYTHEPTVNTVAETLKGYGVEATVTESGEKPPAPPAPPEPPEPPAPKPIDVGPYRKDAIEVAERYFASIPDFQAWRVPYVAGDAKIIAREADRAGMDLALCYAVAEKEGKGRRVFGADWGREYQDAVPFAHLPVIERRAKALLAHIRAGGVSNGVGTFQITYGPFLEDAERYGGLHKPECHVRKGVEVLRDYIKAHGYRTGLGAYNGGPSNPRYEYADSVIALHNQWRRRLAKVGQNQEVNVQEPDSPAPPAKRGPKMEPVAYGTIAKSLVMIATVIAASYSVQVTPDLQSALTLVLTEVLVALGAMGGIGAAERASVTPTAKIGGE